MISSVRGNCWICPIPTRVEGCVSPGFTISSCHCATSWGESKPILPFTRNGFASEQLDRVKQIHRILYRDGLNRTQALEKLAGHAEAASAEFQQVLTFAQDSQRGLAPGGL